MENLGDVDTISATLGPGATRRYQTGPSGSLQVAWGFSPRPRPE